MQIKPSHMLAIVAWASVFMEAWVFIRRQIERGDPLNWTFFVFFLLIAIFSSAIASSKK